MEYKLITSVGIKTIDVYEANPSFINKSEYLSTCPICSQYRKKYKDTCLSINFGKKDNPWHCHHCGEAGYEYKQNNYDKNKYLKPLLSSPKAITDVEKIEKWFLDVRGITKQTLQDFNISVCLEPMPDKSGFSTQKAICFPYYKNGQLINIKFRSQTKGFKLVKGASKILYNIDSLIGEKIGMIVEGEIDALSIHQVGFLPVASVPNGVSITIEERTIFEKTGRMIISNPLNLEYLDLCIDDIDHLEVIIIATDADAPGVKLRNELAKRLGYERCKYIDFAGAEYGDKKCKDANDVLVHCGKETLLRLIDNAKEFPFEGVIRVNDLIEELRDSYDNNYVKGFSTGFKTLDQHMLLVPGWLYVSTGFPNHGKSLLWFNIVSITANLYGMKWGMFCPENYPIVSLVNMLAEIFTGNTIDHKQKDRLTLSRYLKAIEFINKHFIFIEKPSITPSELRKMTEILVKKYGISGMLIDPWKNLKHIYNKNIDSYLERELAEEVNLAVKYNLVKVIVSHPHTPERNVSKMYTAPGPFDIIGGQIWNATAYAQVAYHRQDMDDPTNTMAEIHVQKIKYEKIGGLKTMKSNPVLLRFDRRTNRLLERDNLYDVNAKYNSYPIKDMFIDEQTNINGF